MTDATAGDGQGGDEPFDAADAADTRAADVRDELDRVNALPLEERAAAFADLHARLDAALEEPARSASPADADEATAHREDPGTDD